MTVKIDKFDYDLVENYYMENLVANNFWMFGSHSNEELKPTSTNTQRTAKEFLEKTVFGSKLGVQDFSFMVPVVLWRQGVVYTPFDDRTVLDGKLFYVVVEPDLEGGNYHLFKCISNTSGSSSMNKPEYSGNIQDGIYELPDGYVWKYMSSTPSTTFRRFAARGYMPILRNQDVEDVASDGIYSILVENGDINAGYELLSGIVDSVDDTTGTVFLTAVVRLQSSNSDTSTSLSSLQTFDFSTPGFYNGRGLYIKKNESSSLIGSDVFEITNSGISNSKQFVRVSSTTSIEAGDTIQIQPKVTIVGDGSGATAMPTFENGQIKTIRVLSYGSGYTNATARIVDPAQSFDTTLGAVRATLRPIISPIGGHGSNIIEELKCKHVGISKGFTSAGGTNIPSTGTYSKIGLVKGPLFVEGFTDITFDNRIKMTSSETVASVIVGETVGQGNVRGTVHEVVDSENAILVSDYRGSYAETFVDTLPIDTNSGSLNINTIEYSPYVDTTGDVLFISDVTPIQRTEDKLEQIRLIIDF